MQRTPDHDAANTGPQHDTENGNGTLSTAASTAWELAQ
ncbi:uncharacterized protein G2W53_008077 [Senna tora]|uniref:Uncharacterized protein n=1 Tax=Senna tora TaxID=362788 RepID=A0A835CGK9_9FABA|nr:uncharacterized protein G2W53_008077 [Senna tora]